MTDTHQQKKPPVLKDWAYIWIKDRIISSRFPPGSLLKIEELSRELGISRTPVREALLLLEQEGLVHTKPRVGSFVAEISTLEFIELLEIRTLLECFGVRSLAGVMTETELATVEEMITACENAVKDGNIKAFAKHDIAFHHYLMERAPNSWLTKLMRPIENLRQRKRSIALKNQEHVVASLAEHRAILEALRSGNGELAVERMRNHLHAIQERLIPHSS